MNIARDANAAAVYIGRITQESRVGCPKNGRRTSATGSASAAPIADCVGRRLLSGFFGRYIYMAAVVLACSAKWVTAELARVPHRTVRRWSRYFRRGFVRTMLWRNARGRLMPPVSEAELPASLLERFQGDRSRKLHLALEFLAPVTT